MPPIPLVRIFSIVAAAAALAEVPAAEAQRPGVPLSPRDSAAAELPGGARIAVDYGRPSMRGRQIMGGLVPYGQVWRTGANEATTFTTDVDLYLGEVHVPAGTYTLYTLPDPEGWLLIANRRTGQWGTQYDPAGDLARIPMRMERVDEPVEQFTISLEPEANAPAGRLALAWENTRVSVPYRVAGR